jgi:hypothetical protein
MLSYGRQASGYAMQMIHEQDAYESAESNLLLRKHRPL